MRRCRDWRVRCSTSLLFYFILLCCLHMLCMLTFILRMRCNSPLCNVVCVCACAMNARFWRCRQLRARVPVALQTNGGQRCFHHFRMHTTITSPSADLYQNIYIIIIIITIGHNRRMYHVHAFDEVDFFAATSS